MSYIFSLRRLAPFRGRPCILLGLWLIGALTCRAALPNLTVNHSYASGVATENADQTIGTSGTVQVSSAAQTTFSAGVKVTLSPGFSAQSGSYFHATVVGAPADSDGDGIPDYWETQYGLNPNNASDASLDPNGNGLTNLQEYAAGNNPLPSTLNYELHYDTNQRGQVAAIKKADNTPLAVYTYLSDLRRASRLLSNNTQTDYGYDGAGRMTLLDNYNVPGGSEIQKQEYGYDLRDRRVWTQRDGNLGDTYAYQLDSQLTDFKLNAANPRTTPSGWTQEVSYAYDAAGNRTSVNNSGTVTTYTVDHANQYTGITGATVQYGDGRGNITQWNAWTYTYDANNRLISAVKSGTNLTFVYDPAGRLVKRVTNGQTEYFCYDGAQQLVRTDQNGTLLSSTIWGPNPDEVLIDSTPQNGNRYFHSDIQGTTLAVTDDNRVVLERYRYDPYGNTSFYDASWNARSATAYNVRFLYTGQELMAPADGLYNYKNRLYSPELGRFLQNDPLRLAPGDNNLYRYCGNNPFNNVDPSGEFVLVDDIAVGAVIGVIAAVAYIETPQGQQAIRSIGEGIGQGVEKFKDLFRSTTGTPTPAAIEGVPGISDGMAPATTTGSAVPNTTQTLSTNVTRSQALSNLKGDANIPRTQQPSSTAKVPMTTSSGKSILGADGKPIITREDTYTTSDGKRVVVQDHGS